MNKYFTDLQALKQAMNIFEEEYEVIRTKVASFDNKGRDNSINIKSTVKGSLQRDDNSLSMQNNGTGEHETTNYTLTVVYPEHVDIGDIIVTKEFGNLIVHTERYGSNKYGTSTYTLTRTGTINPIKNAEEYL